MKLPRHLRIEIEEFFEYKWQNDKNLAISTSEDISILE